MELHILVVFHGLQHVEVSDPALHVLIHVGVHGTDEAIPLGRNERADAGVVAGLLGAAADEEAGVVELGGGLPSEQDLVIAGCGGEADQGDNGVGGRGCQAREGECQQKRGDAKPALRTAYCVLCQLQYS